MEWWTQLTSRLIAVPVLWALIVTVPVSAVCAQPGEPKAKGSPPSKRSPEEFFDRERAKLVEKAAKEGARFDAAREMQKLSERFQKDFGESLPDAWQKELGTAAQNVIAPASVPLRQPADSTNTHNTTLRGAGSVHRGPRYFEGLPAWFQERDRNSDGQVGLSEWPRAEFAEFREWDLNQDGFLAQTETVRRMRQLGLAVPQDRAKTMRSNNRTATFGVTTKPATNAAPTVNPAVATGGAVVAKPSPKVAPTPDEFTAREVPKLLDKALREGDRFDAERELQKLRDKYRKDAGAELPEAIEAVLRNAIR